MFYARRPICPSGQWYGEGRLLELSIGNGSQDIGGTLGTSGSGQVQSKVCADCVVLHKYLSLDMVKHVIKKWCKILWRLQYPISLYSLYSNIGSGRQTLDRKASFYTQSVPQTTADKKQWNSKASLYFYYFFTVVTFCVGIHWQPTVQFLFCFVHAMPWMIILVSSELFVISNRLGLSQSVSQDKLP